MTRHRFTPLRTVLVPIVFGCECQAALAAPPVHRRARTGAVPAGARACARTGARRPARRTGAARGLEPAPPRADHPAPDDAGRRRLGCALSRSGAGAETP